MVKDMPTHDSPGKGIMIDAAIFASLPWKHLRTTILDIGESVAFSGNTVWTAEHEGRSYRLQWEWMYEPFFSRPFTMDVKPHSNAVFAEGDYIEHALPLDKRVQTLRSTIDRINWEQTVLDALLSEDQDLKKRLDDFFGKLKFDSSDDQDN
jgi:hypothetical protein